jgi:pimeloyl-ACP methyl ester carboxylesterase
LIYRHRLKIGILVFMAAGYGAWGQFNTYLGYQLEGSFFETEDGVRLHYSDQGVGEPVILLHGYAMNQDLSWRDAGLIDVLAHEYRVIALDFRGHGLSGKPHESRAYGLELTRDVVRLMDHLGIPRAHLIGKSMGAMVTLKLVAEYPDRVISAIPCAMGWVRPWGANVAAQAALTASLEEGNGFDPLLRRLEADGAQPSWLKVQTVNLLVGYINDNIALAKLTARLTELIVSESDLRQNAVPTLAIIGSRDPLLADAENLACTMAHSELAVLPGADHFFISDSPEYLPKVLQFLAAHPDVQSLGLHAI